MSQEQKKSGQGSCCCGAGCCGEPVATGSDKRQIVIDFLYLDLEVCSWCKGTGNSLDGAVAQVTGVLEAAGVEDYDGTVVLVEFYRESNGHPGFEDGAGGDEWLGTDTDGSDGWTRAAIAPVGRAGTHDFYARASDEDGDMGAAARASLALAMAQVLSEAGPAARPGLIRAAAEALDVSIPGAVTQLRAAALALPTDDASARIAAAQIAQDIALGLS